MTAQFEINTQWAGEELPEQDAEILAAAYAQYDQAAWREDAELLAAALLNHALPAEQPSTEPWISLYQAAADQPADQIEAAIYEGLKQLDLPLQRAVYSYYSLMIQQAATRYQNIKFGAQASPKKQKRITTRLIESPDPKLKRQIEDALTADKSPALVRHAQAEALLLNWLSTHGDFVKSSEDQFYYLYQDRHQLYDLDTERWQAFLHTLTGVNPAENFFGQLNAASKTAAYNNAELHEVVKFAHYDREERILRVSRFDGTVYALDGEHIIEETNGAGPVLFDDFPAWQPYLPEETNFDYLKKLGSLPLWQNDPDMYSWIFQVWIQTLFFTELCPTRPIMVMLGEKGSGKSMTLRLLMKLLFGAFTDISGAPDKPDAFTVAAHYYHLYTIDNMDTLTGWMRDKLARISTGSTDEYRKLFTSKEMGVIRYRCWLAITARTPDTLRRDDLADRVVILPLKRINDDQRGRELEFMEWVESNRNAFWGWLLSKLNRIVLELRNGSIPMISPLRMADWEALGRIISTIDGKTDLWDSLVEIIKNEQRNFLAEGEVIIEAIETWLASPTALLASNVGRWVTARELYTESQELLFGNNKPDADWPKSVKSFGWRLKNVSDYLKVRFGMQIVEDKHTRLIKYYFGHQ